AVAQLIGAERQPVAAAVAAAVAGDHHFVGIAAFLADPRGISEIGGAHAELADRERPDHERRAQPHRAHRPADPEGDPDGPGLAADPAVVEIGDADRRAGGGEGARRLRIEADPDRLAAQIDEGVAAAPAAEQAAIILEREADRALARHRRAQHEADHRLRQPAPTAYPVGARPIVTR